MVLRPGEVAEILRVTPRHVRRLAVAGRLERIRLGARTSRYTATSVAALISPSNENGPASLAGPSHNLTDERGPDEAYRPR